MTKQTIKYPKYPNKKITKEVLATVVWDLVDGNSADDIRAQTGLSERRCREIVKIFKAIIDGKDTYCDSSDDIKEE